MINGMGGINGTGPSWLTGASAGAILMNAQAAPLPAPSPGPAVPEAPRPVIPDLSPANDNRMPRPPRPPVMFSGFARALGMAGAMWSAAEVLGGVNDRAAMAQVEAAAEKFGLDLNDPNQRSAAFAYAWAKGPESQLPSWMNRTGIDLPKSGEASDRAAEAVMRMELANPGIVAATIGGDVTARQTLQYAVDLAVDGPTAALPAEWSDVDRQAYHGHRAAGLTHEQAANAVEGDRVAGTRSGVVPDNLVEKLDRYLLNPDHPKGGDKARWLEQALGFTRDNIDDLASQIRFDQDRAVFVGNNGFGDIYNQTIRNKGANGREIDVAFGFTLREDGAVGLNTMIPTKK